jgi:hypothetical protein
MDIIEVKLVWAFSKTEGEDGILTTASPIKNSQGGDKL